MVRLNGKDMNRRLEELLKRTAAEELATVVNVPTSPLLVTGGQPLNRI